MEIGKTIWKDARVLSSCDAPHFFPKTIQYISRHLADVTKVITHHFPLENIQGCLRDEPEGHGSGKVMVEYQ